MFHRFANLFAASSYDSREQRTTFVDGFSVIFKLSTQSTHDLSFDRSACGPIDDIAGVAWENKDSWTFLYIVIITYKLMWRWTLSWGKLTVLRPSLIVYNLIE